MPSILNAVHMDGQLFFLLDQNWSFLPDMEWSNSPDANIVIKYFVEKSFLYLEAKMVSA